MKVKSITFHVNRHRSLLHNFCFCLSAFVHLFVFRATIISVVVKKSKQRKFYFLVKFTSYIDEAGCLVLVIEFFSVFHVLWLNNQRHK